MSKTQRCSRAVVVAALAGVAIMVCGTQAEASPIRFDNPPGEGHFVWNPGFVGGYGYLDIMLAASAQPNTPGPTAMLHTYQATNSQVVGHATGDLLHLQVSDFWDLLGVESGELIPSGFAWFDSGFINDVVWGSQLPEGEETYLGVRSDLGGGWQYGWVGVVRTDFVLDAFAWGYETEVGVPIAAGAPEPGSLALLAFGAVAALRRKRRP